MPQIREFALAIHFIRSVVPPSASNPPRSPIRKASTDVSDTTRATMASHHLENTAPSNIARVSLFGCNTAPLRKPSHLWRWEKRNASIATLITTWTGNLLTAMPVPLESTISSSSLTRNTRKECMALLPSSTLDNHLIKIPTNTPAWKMPRTVFASSDLTMRQPMTTHRAVCLLTHPVRLTGRRVGRSARGSAMPSTVVITLAASTSAIFLIPASERPRGDADRRPTVAGTWTWDDAIS